MNSLPLSHVVILSSRDFTGKTAAYKSCVNTVALNSFLPERGKAQVRVQRYSVNAGFVSSSFIAQVIWLDVVHKLMFIKIL